jgi:hypothetical protein
MHVVKGACNPAVALQTATSFMVFITGSTAGVGTGAAGV